MKLVGWIAAQESDELLLRDTFGVSGEMTYNEADRCFEYCEVDMEAIEKLQHDFPGFLSVVFTAVDDEGDPLPQSEQPFWGMGGGVGTCMTYMKSKHKKHFGWQDLKPVMFFPEYLRVCGPVRWMRSFYNNLGLYFIDDDKGFHGIEWSQFWPPRVWMLRNFLSNSGLTKRGRVLNRVHKYLHRRVMEKLN